MTTAEMPMRIRVAMRVFLWPRRSPQCPNRTTPNGRAHERDGERRERGRSFGVQRMDDPMPRPPSTSRTTPVTYPAAGEQR
jgi:hypothetical protein